MTEKSRFFVIASVLWLWAAAPLTGHTQNPSSAAGAGSGPVTGTCFYYSDIFQGRPVANGEKYDKEAMTAAHNTLPFGTMVKVTNLKNNRSAVVRINDRYPHGGSKSKIIEVTSRAAKELGMFKKGKAEVRIEVMEAAKQ
jgi:rare lipoprotein A